LEKKQTDSVNIIIEDRDSLEEVKYLITGFYGLGLCGYLTTKFLYDAAYNAKKIKRCGIIWSDTIPPVVEVDDTGKFRYPFEILRITNNAAVLLFRYQPSMNIQPGIADILTDLAKEYEITLILCGGIDINAFPQEERDDADIVYVCNRSFEKKYIINGSWNIRKSPPEVVVSGGIALILMYADRRDVPAVSLLTPTIARTGYMDYKASLRLARKIIEIFDLDLNLSIIEERIREIEAQRILRMLEERERRKKEEIEETEEEFGIT